MKKYIVTERAGGFGDIFCTLMGSWILAKYSNRDVIIDWRRNPYNWHCGYDIIQKKSGSYVPINSFLTVFDMPKSLCGVNFYLPEHIADFGVRNSENNFWEYDDLKFVPQDSTNVEETNKILFSDDIFIRNGIRYGTPCEGSPVNMIESSYFDEKINLRHFFENIKINDFILDKIKNNEDRFLKNKVCGIHIRYGNNVETTNPLRYPNWISDDSLINSIKNKIEQFCDKDYHFFICTDTQKVNDMLLKELPNSFSFSKDYSAENEKIMLLNPRLNPISSFQDSFLDMYFLTRCSKLIYISHSVFTSIPQCYYNDNDKSSIF